MSLFEIWYILTFLPMKLYFLGIESGPKQRVTLLIVLFCLIFISINISCNSSNDRNSKLILMNEKQITVSRKNHSLDNNDNFSPDERFLCYDTRPATLGIAHCKSVEKVDIKTGQETVLWEPPSIVLGKDAAPGIAAASWHPLENKIIFIHGPFIDEVEERGYYGIPNRTGTTVDGDGKGELIKLDMRDITTNNKTTPGAHRGGTHRHEYSRDGKRVGFTYNDFLLPDYDRTIGYLEPHKNAPVGYTHYFTVILQPAQRGTSKPGEIEKAYGDSWVNKNGTARAFIGIVRADDGIHYDTSVFVAEIPEEVDITTSYSGDKDTYPTPPEGITIRRLTHDKWSGGIVRSSLDGNRIAYLANDSNNINQVFEVSYLYKQKGAHGESIPRQITRFEKNVATFRWHPSGNWLFLITGGNIAAVYTGNNKKYGSTFFLTNDDKERSQLVVSPDGNILAYNRLVPGDDNNEYLQIFLITLDLKLLNEAI